MSFSGKIALVTGASRGLGQAILLRFAKAGAKVIGTSTTRAGVDLIQETLNAHDYKGKAFLLDVTDQRTIDAMFAELQLVSELPDILINNAGIRLDNLLLRMSADEWSQVIDTNLSAVYRLSKACLKGMLKTRWGRIITISSVAGVAGNPGQVNYAAAKAGVIGFSKSLAQEVASRNITVNVIAPGLIETDMTSSLTDEQQQQLLQRVPMGRMGKPEDVAAAAVFLASEDAAYITGETLQINGGLYMA